MSSKTQINPLVSPKTLKHFIDKIVVDTDTGCWLMDSAPFKNGYRSFHNKLTTPYAHRFAYAAFVGPIPEQKQVQHQCPNGGTKACCNPKHLKLGTPAKNSADAMKAGLYKAPRRKARRSTPAEIVDIRKRALLGESFYSIGKALDRSITYVSAVVSQKLHKPKPKPSPTASGDAAVMKETGKKLKTLYERLGDQLLREKVREQRDLKKAA